HQLKNVPLTKPAGLQDITFGIGTVQATVKVKQADVAYTIPSVPIFETAPHGFLDKWKIEYTNLPLARVTNVKVSGPPDKTELLQKEVPRALLEVSNDDLKTGSGKTLSRQLQFDFHDPAIHVASEDAKREVEFRIVDRSATE